MRPMEGMEKMISRILFDFLNETMLNTGQRSLGEHDEKTKNNDLPMALSLALIPNTHSWSKTTYSDIYVICMCYNTTDIH